MRSATFFINRSLEFQEYIQSVFQYTMAQNKKRAKQNWNINNNKAKASGSGT